MRKEILQPASIQRDRSKRSHSGDRKKVYFLWSSCCPLVMLSLMCFLSVQLNSLGCW